MKYIKFQRQYKKINELSVFYNKKQEKEEIVKERKEKNSIRH